MGANLLDRVANTGANSVESWGIEELLVLKMVQRIGRGSLGLSIEVKINVQLLWLLSSKIALYRLREGALFYRASPCFTSLTNKSYNHCVTLAETSFGTCRRSITTNRDNF